MFRTTFLTLAAALLLLPSAAFADPTADELLKKYDSVMGPESFSATIDMTAHRDDGTTRTYKMTMLKKGTDKFRLGFAEPAAVRGQEMLRQGDNLWVYMPNLKRAVRLANRDSFQGGDFNNADVLRVNYQADYTAKVVADSGRPDAWLIELHAKSKDAAYDMIKLWMRKSDSQPVKGEYYTASGKMLRMAEFSDFKAYNGLTRPGKINMKNMLATQRYSTMSWQEMDTRVNPPSGKFVLDDLGK